MVAHQKLFLLLSFQRYQNNDCPMNLLQRQEMKLVKAQWASPNCFSFLSLLTAEPNGIQMTRSLLQNSGSWEWTADGGQRELGKEIRVFLNLFVDLLKESRVFTMPAGQHGKKITQTPWHVAELIVESLQTRADEKSGKNYRNPMKTKRGITAFGITVGFAGISFRYTHHRNLNKASRFWGYGDKIYPNLKHLTTQIWLGKEMDKVYPQVKAHSSINTCNNEQCQGRSTQYPHSYLRDHYIALFLQFCSNTATAVLTNSQALYRTLHRPETTSKEFGYSYALFKASPVAWMWSSGLRTEEQPWELLCLVEL